MTTKEYEEMESLMIVIIGVVTMTLIIAAAIIGCGTLLMMTLIAFPFEVLISPVVVELYDEWKTKEEEA